MKSVYFDINENIIGTPESIIYKINNEINMQFVSRKQFLLKAMAIFISNEKVYTDKPVISLYGTRTFHKIWEKTCSYVINNEYENIKQYIGHPKWKTVTGKEYYKDTLIPDIINTSKKEFNILDAKYYNITLTDDKLSDNPGVEDITKQYLYQLAFNNYIKSQGFEKVRNILIFPTEEEEISKIGEVTIDFLKKLDLEDIILYKLPAKEIFEMYIGSKKTEMDKFFGYPNR
jgi:hypothetical protein